MLAFTDSWPDQIDQTVLAVYVLLVVGLPLLGYVLLVVDIRTYYRRLKGALVLVSHYTRRLPSWLNKQEWSGREAPACLAAFGLRLPFTEGELLDAYRRRVKELHPDHGGDRDQFLQFQHQFEEARSLLVTEV